MKKNQCAVLILLSGDTIVGIVDKVRKKSITLKNPLKIGDINLRSERVFGFNRHNMFGHYAQKNSYVKYRYNGIATIYRMNDMVRPLYFKMLEYLEKHLDANLRKETDLHIKLIDNSLNPPIVSNEMLKQFEKMLNESRDEMHEVPQVENETTVPETTNKKKKPTHH